jgi:hypothetical protein
VIPFQGQTIHGGTVGVVTSAVVIHAGVTQAWGRPVSGLRSLGAAVARTGQLIASSFAAGIIIGLLLLLLLVPGILRALSYKLILPVVLFEPEANALRRSKELMAGHRGHAFGAIVVAYVAAFAVLFAFSFVLLFACAMAGIVDEGPGPTASAISLASGLAFAAPAALTAALYLQLGDPVREPWEDEAGATSTTATSLSDSQATDDLSE